jgi:hypothetical protein
MGSRMACKSKLSAVERRVMKFSLQSLRTIGPAGWLFAFWSIAFLASWLHFFLYSAENWTTVPSYLRMDICCFFSVFNGIGHSASRKKIPLAHDNGGILFLRVGS